MTHPTPETSSRSLAQLLSIAAATVVLAVPALAVAPDPDHAVSHRGFDARIEWNQGFAEVTPSSLQVRALDGLRAELPELAVTFDRTTGVTRTIYNRAGYLTSGLEASSDPLETALEFATSRLPALGLTDADLEGFEVTDNVFTRVTGASHIYLRQTHRGLPVYNGQLQINVNRDGKIISVNNAFVPELAAAVNDARPSLGAAEAVVAAALHLELDLVSVPAVLAEKSDAGQTTRLSGAGLSLDEIEARLMWLPVRAGDVRLVWSFQIQTLDSAHWYDLTIDAHSGETLTRFDWTSAGIYQVYEEPVESPIHTNPPPPFDARPLVVNPEDTTASPSGWFSGGVMDGNNVHACLDTDNDNSCDTPEATCLSTACVFPVLLQLPPIFSWEAAVSNLFYWNNLIHDVQYQYGFDEAGGNFQEDNFGNGGSGSDSVNAQAQDGGGNCNANFSTPKDGSNPRMQMYTCNRANPSRDGDFDNGVIVHEYGHGISNRQVGGPSNSSCLGNDQQAGEGWSDWLALWYTADSNDTGPQARGIGAYLFNKAANGGTIRGQAYSTDDSVNTWTYESIDGASVPHGVGSRWAQALWEVYWKLVDRHGFSADKYDATGGAGNQRAMLYVNEGLKNTACSPTFVDNRDGILQAAADNHGGEDVCALWEAFAAFGLGEDAVSGGSNSTTPTNGFDVPSFCTEGYLQVGNVFGDEVLRSVPLVGFDTPRVVMGPPSYNGGDPTPVEVSGVGSGIFSYSLPEWDYLDNNHNLEILGFLALEDGPQTLGSLVAEAGSESLDHNWVTVSFEQTFSSAPVVLTQVASIVGGQAVTPRLRNITATSFQIRLQEEEGNNGTHGSLERVDWIAIQPGSTRIDNKEVIVGRTANAVTEDWYTIELASSSAQIFLADIQTFDGTDPAALRYRNFSLTSVQVKVEEEQSADSEVTHNSEEIGYVVIGN